MAETFFQKLQRVRPADIGHLFKFLAALPCSLICRRKRRNLWLICDNENEARDNGYHLYRYIRRFHPETDAVYAINRRSPDAARVNGLGETVHYGSLKHWIYYLSARYNISSQKGGKPNAAVSYVLEVHNILKNTRIFLQHGIIKDDMPWLYYQDTKMRLFVCSTQREWRFVSDTYGYPEGWVQKLGICRLDALHDFQVKPKQVLLMPTWRSWIAAPTSASKEIENVTDFTATAYYRGWSRFLQSERLAQILEDNDLQLVFYPHRDMQGFLSFFQTGSDRITVASWPEYDVQTLLKESAYLITDYSSIAMDFSYMKKRLMYYQFDYADFRKGQYPEGYFSYEQDGFGPVCYDTETALNELETAAEEGFANPQLYRARQDAFFDLYDTHNCERNYQAIAAI